jgi:hypothetical protein
VFTKQPKDVDYGDADPFSIAGESVFIAVTTPATSSPFKIV